MDEAKTTDDVSINLSPSEADAFLEEMDAYVAAVHARRWATLADYRAMFDEALAEVRAATDRTAAADPDWVGPVKARQEISEALDKAYCEYERFAEREALS